MRKNFLNEYEKIEPAVHSLKKQGFRLYGTNLGIKSKDYRECDFSGPTAFVLGAEKWGLSPAANNLMDQSIYIPMRGMVQSLNVSVAAASLLFEALRQREKQGLVPKSGEGIYIILRSPICDAKGNMLTVFENNNEIFLPLGIDFLIQYIQFQQFCDHL